MKTDIHGIDEHLLHLRQAQSRPDYRRRLLNGLEDVTSVAALRILRSIGRAEAAGREPSIRYVAEDLEIEHSTASRGIRETTKRKLTARQPSDHDQRQVRLSLTEHGHRSANLASENRQKIIAEALRGWDEADVRQFSHFLGHFVQALSTIDPGEDGTDG